MKDYNKKENLILGTKKEATTLTKVVSIASIIILVCIISLLLISNLSGSNNKTIDKISAKENSIPLVITVDKIYLAYSNELNDNIIYIKDIDKHLFIINKFDPEILLLDEGDVIRVYVPKSEEDNNIIDITNYDLYGVIPSEYLQ